MVWSWVDQIINRLRGQKLGVLGERGVGKTHLQTFLREGRIPTVYVQTQTQERLASSKAQLWEVESLGGQAAVSRIRLKSGFDVPGSAGAVEAWKEVVNASTILLYLFRADLVFDDDIVHLKRIEDDAALLSKLIHERVDSGAHLKTALVGTHYDKVLGYKGPSCGSAFYRWHVEMENNQYINDARLTVGGSVEEYPKLVVGSMSTLEGTRELAFRLFARELRV